VIWLVDNIVGFSLEKLLFALSLVFVVKAAKIGKATRE